MQKIHHVFISSTYSDLKDERKKVSEAIAKAGYIPEGMELFPASSQKQLDFIKRSIDRCDYYVVIVGGRYGSIADGNISYTEQEYRYALDRGIPTLAFLHSNPEEIEARKVDKSRDNVRRLAAFREHLKSAAMVDFWSSADGLATSVVVALGQEVTLSPGVGWVRGDQAIDPKILEELALARAHIAELQTALNQANNNEEFSFPKDIAPVDVEFTFVLHVQDKPKEKGNSKEAIEVGITSTWKAIFLLCAPHIYRGASEEVTTNTALSILVQRQIGTVEDTYSRTIAGRMNGPQMRYQFEALGLITTESIQSSGLQSTVYRIARSGGEIFWRLTDKGRKYIAFAQAWRAGGE